MSRVDDAMRRAAAGHDSAGRDASVLEHEPYPIEMPDRHRPHDRTAIPALGSEPRVIDKPVDIKALESRTAPRPAETVAVDPAASSSTRLFDRFHARVSEKTVVDRRMPVRCREQYRRLAAVLHDAQSAHRTQVVMVASAVAGEGKTLTAANVALTLSDSYRKRVLLIDGDLRRPVLHQLFRVDAASGLTDSLASAADMKIVVRQLTPTLALLPAGRPTTDPMASLISERMRRLIEEARETFDWIIIDTPPLNLLPDAHLLAAMADAAVLVVRAESTPHAIVKRAVDAIGSSRILGIVLNRTTAGSHPADERYGDYYAATAAVASR